MNTFPTSPLAADSPPGGLLHALLGNAGIRKSIDSISLLGTSTNHVWKIGIDGQLYIMRHRLDGDEKIALKEVYLSQLLRNNGVPAAEVLAFVSGDVGVATLCSWMTGLRLDRAIQTLSENDIKSLWRSAGEVLRQAHEILLPHAGEISGNEVESFIGGWGKWVLEDAVQDIHWLQLELDLPRVSRRLLEKVVIAATTALTSTPTVLLHNDALPQNILVNSGVSGWICTAWVDWEFARAGDPLWDLCTLDFRPAGLVPSIFYDGYGWYPDEPHISIYELLMTTWRTRAELEHDLHWDWPPQHERLKYLCDLPTQIERLAEMLGVGK